MVAILAAIATPSILRGLPEKRLRSAARNLYADLQKARLLAVKHNTNVVVTFVLATGTYSYCTQFDATVTPYLCIESKTVTLGNGVNYGSGSAGDGNGGGECNVDKKDCTKASTIQFFYKGTASSNGSVYLQNQNDDICYALSVSNYGNVKIRRFNGKSWDEK
jgi:type IV fimbrial biogenesis protein FimT